MMFGLIFYFMKYRTLQKRFINVENCQDGDEMDAFYGGDMQGGNKRLQLNWDDCRVAFDKKNLHKLWSAAYANLHVWSMIAMLFLLRNIDEGEGGRGEGG